MKSKNFLPILFLLLGIAVGTQLRNFWEATIFLFAATGQFTAYVFVSRLRQRGSFFWHAIAGLASNGMWYATSHILSSSRAYWMLFTVYIIGLIAGRLAGANLAQYIEKRFKLKSDATRDPNLAPGKRLEYIKREPMFWALTLGLASYMLWGYLGLASTTLGSLFTVIGLGILQNFFYAVNTRADCRGHNWYITISGILSGITFSISAVYLFSKGMPLILFVPYTLSTALGSTIGAFFSMIFEWTKNLRPDSHLEKDNTIAKEKESPWKERLPHIFILGLMAVWILFQEAIFKMLGISINRLNFPISFVTRPMPRMLIILTAASLFFLDSAFHTLTSRAGNRNHTGYHVSTLIPKGLVDFFKVSYLALNDKIIDIIPISVLASCLGSLCAKDVAEKIERWLMARMDTE